MSTTVQYANGMGTAELSLSEDNEYVIHGIALGEDDVTHGASRTRKLWPGEELRKASDTLAGRPLVKDHNNTVEGRVGTVRKSNYLDGAGVIYEAVIDPEYENLARKVERGDLEVSARVFHRPSEELEEDPETGALVTENLRFDNLSLVLTGASRSNTANWGESEHLEHTEVIELEVATLHDEFEFEGEPVELGIVNEEDMTEEQTEEEEEELESYDYHVPEYSGTTNAEWSQPDMGDFDTENLDEIDDHFFLSETGFPPESYTDLSIPVVEPDGQLSLGGLRTAISGHGWQATSVDEKTGNKIDKWCRGKANEEFGKDWDGSAEETPEGEEENLDESESSMKVTDLDDLQRNEVPGTRVENVPDELGLVQIDMDEINVMTDTKTIDDVEDADDYVAVNEDELNGLIEKAGKFDDLDGRLENISGSMEELGNAQELVDAVGKELVEELQDYEQPHLMEQSAREKEQDMVKDVGQLYAETLATAGPFGVDELMERFTPLELRNKVEDDEELSLGNVESNEDENDEDEEDDEPDYKGQAGEDEDEEDESEDEEEELTAARNGVVSTLNEMGWSGTADRVQNGEIDVEELNLGIGGDK